MRKATVILSILLLTATLASCAAPLTPSPYSDGDVNSGAVVMRTQYDTYVADIEWLYITIENPTDKQIEFGSPWSMEKLSGGVWMSVPFKPDTCFTSVLYVLQADGVKTEAIWLGGLDHKLTDGKYRVVKEIKSGELTSEFTGVYTAEFTVGDSPITADAPNGLSPLEKLPKNYGEADAKADDAVITRGYDAENIDRLTAFAENVTVGLPDTLRVCVLNDSGEAVVITDYIYEADNDRFRVRTDSTRRSDEHGAITEQYVSYLCADAETNLVWIANANAPVWEDGSDRIIIDSGDTAEPTRITADAAAIIADVYAERTPMYRVFNADGTRSVAVSERDSASDAFDYWLTLPGMAETCAIGDKMNCVTAVSRILWTDEKTVLFICETDMNADNPELAPYMYYEFIDTDTAETLSYTISQYGYTIEDGQILIRE